MIDILKAIDCTVKSHPRTKLYELEKLLVQYSIHLICETLEVDRGTFYNHIKMCKKENSDYVKYREEITEHVLKVFHERKQILSTDKIVSVLKDQGLILQMDMFLKS